jgi:hypothetical protein
MLARGSRVTKKRKLCRAGRTSYQNLRRSWLQKSSTYCGKYAYGFLEPAALHLLVAGSLAKGFMAKSRSRRHVRVACRTSWSALDFTGRGEGFVDFPKEASLDFRDLLCTHAEHTSPLSQLFKVGLDVELSDVRREALK